MRRHQTDLLYSIRERGSGAETLVYVLVEHSSRVGRWMAFRLLEYQLGIWRDLLRQRPRLRRLPRIVPVVIHHGRRAWWAATEFAELVAGTGDGEKVWRQPRYRYAVLSTAEMAPDQLDCLALSLFGKLTMAALQFVPRADASRLAAAFGRWGGLMRRLLAGPSGEEAMVALSQYVLTTTVVPEDALIEIVEKEVSRGARNIMETTGARLRREGRAEGRAEGGRSILCSQLQARLAAAADETMADLALRLLTADSLADLFGDDPSGD
ncbi:MAG: Rpn family recombination-promoting nuclease/putative transposase [Planctomycetes bacterium]|nr:Rpn family recombination-promoting nuclease/putative transposase [Planctomycetota bacterium]